MTEYYFLGSLLSPLSLGQKPELSFARLVSYFSTGLTKADLEKVRILRRLIDLYNLRSLWLEQPIDPRGNLTENELEEDLITQSDLPAYVFDFTAKYDTAEKRVRNFPWLVHKYFEREIEYGTGFLKEYLTFERNLRLVMVGLRAKAMGKDLLEELQFEDPHDPMVALILSQRDSPQFELPDGYEPIKQIFENKYATPLELQEALSEYRFNHIESMLEGQTFTTDRILGYMLQLLIVEQWQELQTQEGLKIVDSIVEETK
jgi:hypothetical protein